MGRSKQKTRTKNRTSPISKPIKPPSDPELAVIREKQILPCIKDLQSPDLKTRSAAANVITNIIQDSRCRKLLLREQIVRILLEQTLTDLSLETRTAGWGILRNLTLEEQADFCIHLYRQDILTATEGAVNSVIKSIESKDHPISKLPKAQQNLLWNLTSSVINLLSDLSEAQDEIAETISQRPTLVAFLFGLLSFESVPEEVNNDTLSCLASLTEDNKLLVQQIVDNGDWLKKLIQIKDCGDLKAVTVCGVLHNIFTTMQWFDHNTPIVGMSDAILIPILVESIELAQIQGNDTNGQVRYSSPDQVLQLALDITASIATSLQEALENGSRHEYEKEFEGFDDDGHIGDGDEMDADEEDHDYDNVDKQEEMDEHDIDADMALVAGDMPDDNEDADSQMTLTRLVREAAPRILLCAQPSQNTSLDRNAIQSHALSALNNIAWTVSSIDFSSGHLARLHQYWSSFAQGIWNEIITPVLASNTADIELASSITSLAWAVARSQQGNIQIQPEEPRKFMALYQASKGLNGTGNAIQTNGSKKALEHDDFDAFQSLGVKCIGVLGRLALDPAPIDLNREIGVFLLTILANLPDAPAADAVEALNQIFDIYADRSYDFDEAVFWTNGFYRHLEEIVPKVKKLAKSIDKRKSPELRSRTDEALLNLGRFLRYKKSERTT